MTATVEGLQRHPARDNPPRDFLYKSADRLRQNITWRHFLESIHPTIEHCFFVNAEMDGYATSLKGLTVFECQYLRQNYGEALKAAFGAYVTLKATRRVN